MRITLLGAMSILAGLLSLAYIGQEIERKRNQVKKPKSRQETHDTTGPDGTRSF